MEQKDSDTGKLLLELDAQRHGGAGRQNRGRHEGLKKLFPLLGGCFCAYMGGNAFRNISTGRDAVFAVLEAAAWGIGAGFAFSHAFLGGIGQIIGNGIYAPAVYLSAPPEKLSPIRGDIIAGRIEEAIVQLRAVIERHPQTTAAVLMLAELYADSTGEPEAAYQVLERYFFAPHPIVTENITMLMLYSDLCRDLGRRSQAMSLLRQELQRKGYSRPDRQSIQARIDALAGS